MHFTGERVVPHDMGDRPDVLSEHLIRYAIALRWCSAANILDVACGTGYGMAMIRPIAQRIWGGDIDDNSLNYARANYGLKDLCKIDLSTQSIQTVFKRKFDIIISFETIEHIENPKYFMNSVRESLLPGGYFIFSVPVSNESEFHKSVFSYNKSINLGNNLFKEHKTFIQTASYLIPKELIVSKMSSFAGLYIIRIMQ